jgi:hypothetical protein
MTNTQVPNEVVLTRVGKPNSPELLRGVIDADMQAGLGRFFAAKFRAGVLYAVYERNQIQSTSMMVEPSEFL